MNVPAQIGNYRIERELGRGASSEVWQARHIYLDDYQVAIKVLMNHDRETIQRFKREAAIATRLHHPHIVRLYDYGQVSPFFYAVMELIEGESLQKELHERRHFDLPEACTIFSQMASALDYAHNLGVIHRDVSPANILVEKSSKRVLLTDFGIARDAGQPITVANAIMGTRGYHSPEHAQSAARVTHLSDIFSLGVVLYQMLSGELPWANLPGLGEQVEFTPPIPLAQRGVEGVPTEVDRVLRTLLAIDPVARYPTATAAATELRQILVRHQTRTQRVGSVPIQPNPVELKVSGIEANSVEHVFATSLVREVVERARTRAAELCNPEIVAEILNHWAEQDPLRRRLLLGRLARLHKVASRNLYFYQLRLLYEQRELPEHDEEPDRTLEVFPVEREIAPWDVTLPPADFAADPSNGRVNIPGSTHVVTCEPCAGRGFTICPRCQGRQRIYVSRPAPTSDPMTPRQLGSPAAPASAPRPPGSPAAPASAPRPPGSPAAPAANSRPVAPAATPTPSVPATPPPTGANPTTETSTAAVSAVAAASPRPTETPGAPASTQVIAPCPDCSGRGGVTCSRCAGIGRLVRRKAFRWSRKPVLFNAQDDLSPFQADWLVSSCKSAQIYHERINGEPGPEWAMIEPVAALIKQAAGGLNAQTRIVLSELSIQVIPITEIVFDLGKRDEQHLYKLVIYGFENLIPPDWRFFNWERVTLVCTIAFLLVIILVLTIFTLLR